MSFRQALKNLLIREAMKNAKIQAILFFSYRRSLKVIIYMVHVKIKATYPFSQVVGQNEISGEGV